MIVPIIIPWSCPLSTILNLYYGRLTILNHHLPSFNYFLPTLSPSLTIINHHLATLSHYQPSTKSMLSLESTASSATLVLRMGCEWNQWETVQFENGNQWDLFHEYAFPVMGNSWKFDLEKDKIGSFCGNRYGNRGKNHFKSMNHGKKNPLMTSLMKSATPLSPALVARVDFGPEKKNWGHWKVWVMFFYRVRPCSSIRLLKIAGKVWFDWPSRFAG